MGHRDPPLEAGEDHWLPEVREAIERGRERARQAEAKQHADPETQEVEETDKPAGERAAPQFPYDPEADMYARRIRRKFGTDLQKGLPPDDEDVTR